MAKFTKTGNWYVDTYYGNDTSGTGTKENPFATMNRAFTAAGNNQTIVFTGRITESLPNSKGLHFVGEGLAVWDGAGFGSNVTAIPSLSSLDSIKFENFIGTNLAFAGFGSMAFRRLECYNTRFQIGSNSGGSVQPVFEYCIFNECFITGSAGSGNGTFVMNKCTWLNCTGKFPVSPGTFNITNNLFYLCDTITMGNYNNSYTIFPESRPPLAEFNYNNIIGKLWGKTNAEWRAYGTGSYQQSPETIEANIQNILNDYSTARDSTNHFLNNFTMKPTCILKDAGKDGLEIGARRIGYRYTAFELWNTYRQSSTNLTYSDANGFILLDAGQGIGTFESVWIALPYTMAIDAIRFFANFVYNGANPVQYVDTNPNAAPSSTVNQRWNYDCDFAIANNNIDAPVWTKQEIGQAVKIDNAGLGNSETNYNPATGQTPRGSYIKLRFNLVNTAV